MSRDDNSFMAPLHLAGRLIMEHGGETYRVEETITRMGHAFGFAEVECFAIPSGIFISYRKHDGSIETAVGAGNLELLSRSVSFYSCILICGVTVLIKYLALRKRRNRL